MLPELPWTVRVEPTPFLLRLFGWKPFREVKERRYAHIGGDFTDREVKYLSSPDCANETAPEDKKAEPAIVFTRKL